MNNSLHSQMKQREYAIAGLFALLLFALLLVILLPASFHFAIACAAFSIAGAAVVWVLFRHRRLSEQLEAQIGGMAETALEMARRGTDKQIDVGAIPLAELRSLAHAINAMAERATGDIAELKRLERVRSEFLGNVSHELRTPIFSVQGYLETLIDGAMDDPNVREDFLNKAHHNVLRLHTLLTDLIEISRIESGEMKMSFRYFNADEFLRSIVEELRPTAQIAGIELHYAPPLTPNGNATVFGDRERIKQAMVNLIENAIKYNKPNGLVTVSLELVGEQGVFRVADTGIGIPEGDIRRIFERFYRVNKDRSRAVGGSGLGLAIVKHIIEAHNATITVRSVHGEGSTFSFWLKRG
ncbi:MAG: two-component sensor histidine kinase [Candidatus Kapabacteria bacterium]|nr:two-component sensor histidine kinase [Candidatus Kapabacteria bacterium]